MAGDDDRAAPLGWFGLFERVERIDADAVAERLPDPASAWVGRVSPRVTRGAYEAMVERVLGFIDAGDIYQANITFRADVAVLGNPWRSMRGCGKRRVPAMAG